MIAIISDVHSNLEALQAVLDDALKQHVEQIISLGDMIGYGPNPRECLDILSSVGLTVALLGNHDDAILGKAEGFKASAERALRWTKEQLQLPLDTPEAPEQRRLFLASCMRTYREDDFLFVHASPRDPLNEYIYPEHGRDPQRMAVLFWMVPRYCFMGHTHWPGVFTEGGGFQSPKQLDNGYRLDGRKVMCNVGSVGQPRDGDRRACYVLLDDSTIRFRRVEYDVRATLKKVKAQRELDASYWK